MNIKDLSLEKKLKLKQKLLDRQTKDELLTDINKSISKVESKAQQDIKEIKNELNKIRLAEPAVVKGIDGKSGKQGIKGDRGLQGVKGEKGVNGKDGRDGIDGIPGSDGSPDTPIEIVKKLESLKGDKRLDAEAIKNLDKFVHKTAKGNVTVINAPGGGGANTDVITNTFEFVSKNLKSYPYTLNYTNGVLDSIVYTFGSQMITKSLSYLDGNLITVILSGDIPNGIDTTKTLSYSGGNLSNISYS